MITWRQLCQAVLTGTATSLYTAPTATSTAIHQASAWNPTAGVVTVKVYIGAAASDATTVWSGNVPAGQSVPISPLIAHKLNSGLQIWASGNGVTITISGAENVVQ